jgi:putative salt-induced outer membrane protein
VLAQATPAAPTGAPPPEAKALVAAPKEGASEPDLKKPLDGTTVTASAGGLLTTGNARLLALTASGVFDTRFDNNGVLVSILGNYGQGAPQGSAVRATAQNIQGRLRYDRYVIDEASVFLINTGRHDRFQGLDFRYNLDPGFKYLFVKEPRTSLWAEAGYDFQYDVRRDDARPVLDANKNPTGVLLDKTATDHSTRLFAGFKHAFNQEVTFSTGLEYLQSVVDSTRYRLNYDALFAAKLGAGLALGFGFTTRYDHAPLPGKEQVDTTTTVSLIYAFSDVGEAPKAKTCPCPEEKPAEPVPAAPSSTPTAAPPTPTPTPTPATVEPKP